MSRRHGALLGVDGENHVRLKPSVLKRHECPGNIGDFCRLYRSNALAECRLARSQPIQRLMLDRSLILSLTLLLPAAAGAQAADPDSDYLRIAKDETGAPIALQAPIVSFEPANGEPGGLRVDLVGAIHVADADYFANLNDRFAEYDAVLYELVAAEDARPTPNAEPTNLVSSMQIGITQLLDLRFQLDAIDYARPNFVHADLTPEALAQSMSDRNESVLTYLSRILSASVDEDELVTPSISAPALLAMLFSPDRARMLKTLLATSMLDVETFSRIIEGETGSALVGERNARAVAVLADRIRHGDRHIAIFYGVAHLPDMARRLETDMGLTRREISWIDAWDLRANPTPDAPP